MNWQKLLSDLAITTERPVDESLVYFAMLIDLYSHTKNRELRHEIEQNFIKIFRGGK